MMIMVGQDNLRGNKSRTGRINESTDAIMTARTIRIYYRNGPDSVHGALFH